MSEWGPWIEHDGKGCPVKGQFVHAVIRRRCGRIVHYRIIAGLTAGRSWDWTTVYNPVIRYRIRKPSALQQLKEMVESLPELETVQ